ncbi:MAG TPA: hypothetical protein VGK34_00485 [Armatimonadota bacterium]
MREFIKTHPWRLEIVPAISLVLSISIACFYHVRYADRLEILLRDARTHDNPGMILNTICVSIVFLWLMEMNLNHWWVTRERRKRFNWIPVVFQFAILIQAWGACLLIYILHQAATHTSSVIVPWATSTVYPILGLCVTTMLEATRKYIPRDDEHEPPPPSNVLTYSDGFCYREVKVDWIHVICSTMLIVGACISAVQEHVPYMFAIGILGGGFCAWLGFRIVTITSQEIVAYSGPFKKFLKLAEINECCETFIETGYKTGPNVQKSLHGGFGPCLEVKTCNGKIHLFGMLRPHFACGLIESAKSKDNGG